MVDININDRNKDKIPLTVVMIGIMMFLVNMSYLMIYSISGVYLKSIGVAITGIMFLEGIAEFTSYIMKLLSGVISDHFKRRKSMIVLGYIVIVLSRIVLALNPIYMVLFLSRMAERLGNGVQSTPRDALVGDIAPASRLGETYGLKRMLAQAGAFFGALVCIFAMKLTGDNYQQVFLFACAPAVVALLILIFFVKEPKETKQSAVTSEIPLAAPKRKHPITMANLKRMGRSYWLLMLVAIVFYTARMGETFLTLHANENFSMEPTYISSIMIVFNAAYCLISYPAGYISDRMNRYWILALGIIFLVMSDMLLATSESLFGFFVGVMFWGFQYGVTQNVFITLVAGNVPEDLRGTGIGFFYLVCAIGAIFADNIAGFIAHSYGEHKAFMVSGFVAIFALITLIMTMGYRAKKV